MRPIPRGRNHILPAAKERETTRTRLQARRRRLSSIKPSTLTRCAWAVGGLIFILAWATPAAEIQPPESSSERSELPLEALMKLEIPTVQSASKYNQKATEAPASVSVITAEEVKKYGYRTLADILQSVRGLNVSYDRNY